MAPRKLSSAALGMFSPVAAHGQESGAVPSTPLQTPSHGHKSVLTRVNPAMLSQLNKTLQKQALEATPGQKDPRRNLFGGGAANAQKDSAPAAAGKSRIAHCSFICNCANHSFAISPRRVANFSDTLKAPVMLVTQSKLIMVSLHFLHTLFSYSDSLHPFFIQLPQRLFESKNGPDAAATDDACADFRKPAVPGPPLGFLAQLKNRQKKTDGSKGESVLSNLFYFILFVCILLWFTFYSIRCGRKECCSGSPCCVFCGLRCRWFEWHPQGPHGSAGCYSESPQAQGP